jgi:hypothetical protein
MPPVQTANRNLNFRITDDEYNYLNFKAFQSGLTLTEYIKSRILESDFVGQTSRPKARPNTRDDRDENGFLKNVPNVW